MRLIDADKLRTLFDENCASECAICTYYESCKENLYCGLIDLAPTVEERPHGKWMLSPNWSGYCCSNCGANPLDTNIDTTRVKSKDVLGACPFCRLCGAKMEAADGD